MKTSFILGKAQQDVIISFPAIRPFCPDVGEFLLLPREKAPFPLDVETLTYDPLTTRPTQKSTSAGSWS